MSLSKERCAELDELCRVFRIDVLKAVHSIQSGHPGGSLSVCEILTLLYQEEMNISADDPENPDRDRLVLCKGHAAPMLYRNLIEKGFLPKDSMATLRRINSQLQGHPSNHTPGVEMPSGPLGIGLSAAQGMAMGLKLNGSPARVYAILGDGELDEGAVWEAAASAPKFALSNLTAIVDYNKVQLDGTTDEVMPLRDLEGKWKAFGWSYGDSLLKLSIFGIFDVLGFSARIFCAAPRKRCKRNKQAPSAALLYYIERTARAGAKKCSMWNIAGAASPRRRGTAADEKIEAGTPSSESKKGGSTDPLHARVCR